MASGCGALPDAFHPEFVPANLAMVGNHMGKRGQEAGHGLANTPMQDLLQPEWRCSTQTPAAKKLPGIASRQPHSQITFIRVGPRATLPGAMAGSVTSGHHGRASGREPVRVCRQSPSCHP